MLERKREREAGSVAEGDGGATVQTTLESEEGKACGRGGTDAGNMVKAVLLPVTALLSGPAIAVAVAAVTVVVAAREDDDARPGADGTSSIAFSGKSATHERREKHEF